MSEKLASQCEVSTQHNFFIEASAEPGQTYLPIYAEKETLQVKVISSSQIAVVNKSNKYEVDIFEHDSDEIYDEVLPRSETEITSLVASTENLIIANQTDVLIYKMGEYAEPKKIIRTVSITSELAIYNRP